MTYEDLKLNDGQILDVLMVARKEGALAMIHAENSECISWLTKKLLASGHTAPCFHAEFRPMLVEREASSCRHGNEKNIFKKRYQIEMPILTIFRHDTNRMAGTHYRAGNSCRS
jgi:hypothetical protein